MHLHLQGRCDMAVTPRPERGDESVVLSGELLDRVTGTPGSWSVAMTPQVALELARTLTAYAHRH